MGLRFLQLFVGPKELRAASLQILVVRQTFAGDYVEPQIPRRQSQIGRHLLELESPPTDQPAATISSNPLRKLDGGKLEIFLPDDPRISQL
jgi:hypothetical protein